MPQIMMVAGGSPGDGEPGLLKSGKESAMTWPIAKGGQAWNGGVTSLEMLQSDGYSTR
jgi:hypothetical protein